MIHGLARYRPHVGVYTASGDGELRSVRKCKKQDLSFDEETLLKESLVRSLYWKMDKYRMNCDEDYIRYLEGSLRKRERECERARKERDNYKWLINRFQSICRRVYGKRIDVQEFVEKENEMKEQVQR